MNVEDDMSGYNWMLDSIPLGKKNIQKILNLIFKLFFIQVHLQIVGILTVYAY